jgi:hypothetical protein
MATTLTNSGSIDRLRQGTSIRTSAHRFNTTQPKIFGGARDKISFSNLVPSDSRAFNDTLHSQLRKVAAQSVINHDFEDLVFGQSKSHNDGTAYSDATAFDPVKYISSTESIPKNRIRGFAGIELYVANLDPNQYNGVIEPIPIRSQISKTSVRLYQSSGAKHAYSNTIIGADSVSGISATIENRALTQEGHVVDIDQKVHYNPETLTAFNDEISNSTRRAGIPVNLKPIRSGSLGDTTNRSFFEDIGNDTEFSANKVKRPRGSLGAKDFSVYSVLLTLSSSMDSINGTTFRSSNAGNTVSAELGTDSIIFVDKKR